MGWPHLVRRSQIRSGRSGLATTPGGSTVGFSVDGVLVFFFWGGGAPNLPAGRSPRSLCLQHRWPSGYSLGPTPEAEATCVNLDHVVTWAWLYQLVRCVGMRVEWLSVAGGWGSACSAGVLLHRRRWRPYLRTSVVVVVVTVGISVLVVPSRVEALASVVPPPR